MISTFGLTSLALLLASSSLVLASDKDEVRKLMGDVTQLDRLKRLDKDADWLYDFRKDQKTYTSNPGSVVVANAAHWPALYGNGMTVQLITLGPCGMLPAHFHPRASNIVTHVAGPDVHTQMFEENEARVVNQTFGLYQSTIFPQGSIHTMVNNDCNDELVLISALNHEDQGTSNLANSLYKLDWRLVQGAFGGGALPAEKAIPEIGSGATSSGICIEKCPAGSKAKKALKNAK